MVEQLARAVDSLVAPDDAEGFEQVLRIRDRLDAKVAEGLWSLDRSDGWRADGSLSLTAWLAWHGRISQKDAHREAVVARRLSRLPVTAAAWASGELSSGQVAAIVANVSAPHAGLFAGQEADLVPELAPLSVRETASVMGAWRLRAEALDERPEPAERPSELHLSETLEGRRELTGHFRPEDGAVIETALGAASAPPWDGTGDAAEGGPPPSAAERRAEALVEICRQFLSRQGGPGSSARRRPQLNVVVDLEDLQGGGPGRLADGTPLSPGTVERLGCDCELHRVVMAGRSGVVDYGTSTRTAPPALWAALVVRDGHCRHPGCDRPPPWSEAHHVVHFKDGGPTRLDNLVLACARHHHLWHDQGWKLMLHPDASLDLVTPGGAMFTSKPPPHRLR
ncbi:MAG: DUF222 domain-containing protein [Acidimicrobiales bacterium]